MLPGKYTIIGLITTSIYTPNHTQINASILLIETNTPECRLNTPTQWNEPVIRTVGTLGPDYY